MANVRRDPERDYLFEAILPLETVDDCYRFFDDLCTVKEISEMARRMSVAKMLDENTVYNDIVARTGLSTATISRVNRCLRYGSDGYRDVLDRLKHEPAETQRMFLLYYGYGMTLGDIALETGKTMSAVKSRLVRVRRKLRTTFGEEKDL